MTLGLLPVGAAAMPVQAGDSALTTQDVLNQIHGALPHRDRLQNNNCHIGGPGNPHIPCRHDRILPTSAVLRPNRGGFHTACENPYISTFHYYRIEQPGNESYATCGPLSLWGTIKIGPTTFQPALNRIGRGFLVAAGAATGQQATAIWGDRAKVTARFRCPASGEGVQEVALRQVYRLVRGRRREESRATAEPCAPVVSR